MLLLLLMVPDRCRALNGAIAFVVVVIFFFLFFFFFVVVVVLC